MHYQFAEQQTGIPLQVIVQVEMGVLYKVVVESDVSLSSATSCLTSLSLDTPSSLPTPSEGNYRYGVDIHQQVCWRKLFYD